MSKYIFVFFAALYCAFSASVAENLSSRASKCTTDSVRNIVFYGKIITLRRQESAADCVIFCYTFKEAGKERCQSVNYIEAKKQCELMSDKLDVKNSNQVKYYTEENRDAVYYAPITCTIDSGDDSVEPERPTRPTSAPIRPTVAPGGNPTPAPGGNPNPVPGSCGQTFVSQRAVKVQRPPGNNSSGRIVGGTEARPNSFPWIVSLQSNNFHFCGGTLIRVSERDESDVIVTAAHCVYDSHRGLQVVAGAHDLDGEADGEQRVDAYSTSYHGSYNPDTMVNDIAVIKLREPIKFSRTAQPACLPKTGEQVLDGSAGTVAGWGLTREEGRSSKRLLQVNVPAVDAKTCAANYRPMQVFPQVMLCAGYSVGGKDACQGDSGGPLTYKSGETHTLQGVVSFGIGCARSGKPGIYARVSNYIAWINQQIRELSDVARSG